VPPRTPIRKTVVKCNVYHTNFKFGIILKIGVQVYFSSKLPSGVALFAYTGQVSTLNLSQVSDSDDCELS